MTEAEFSRLWVLFGELFPAAVRKKGEKNKAVWRKGTEPFLLSDVTAAVMEHARKNNFFPDLAEIVSGLEQDEQWKYVRGKGESAIAHNAKLYAKIAKVQNPNCEVDAEYMQWFRRVEAAREN